MERSWKDSRVHLTEAMFYFAPVFGANYVLVAGYILPDTNGVWHAPFPSGSGTVATIQFKAIYEPPARTNSVM